MPTKNRRVATYLPKDIDDRFASFKSERGIEGDSQALIVILSEFLGVAHQVDQKVDYQLNFVTKDELEQLTSKVAHLSEQVQSFEHRLNHVTAGTAIRSKDELLSELLEQTEASKTSSSQLDLLEEQSEKQGIDKLQAQSSIPSELLGGLSARALEKRFKEGGKAGRGAIASHKDLPNFPAWSSIQDPEGISWKYQNGKYYPIQNATSSSPGEL